MISIGVDRNAGPFAYNALEASVADLNASEAAYLTGVQQLRVEADRQKSVVLNRIAAIAYPMLSVAQKAEVSAAMASGMLSVTLDRRGVDGPGTTGDSAMFEITLGRVGEVTSDDTIRGATPSVVSSASEPDVVNALAPMSTAQMTQVIASWGLDDEDRVAAEERIMAMVSGGVPTDQALALYDAELQQAITRGVSA